MSRIKEDVKYTPVILNTLSNEQLALIPKVGSIIIANEKNTYYRSNGLSSRDTEKRCCYIVESTAHPRLVTVNEVRAKVNGKLVTKTTYIPKSDFYAKLVVWTAVKEPVWSVGKDSLSWDELAIERFAI